VSPPRARCPQKIINNASVANVIVFISQSNMVAEEISTT